MERRHHLIQHRISCQHNLNILNHHQLHHRRWCGHTDNGETDQSHPLTPNNNMLEMVGRGRVAVLVAVRGIGGSWMNTIGQAFMPH